MTTLYINNYPICGCVGKPSTLTISVQDCWQIYWKQFKDIKFSPSPELSIWRLDTTIIPRPTSWFITIENI